MKCPLKGKECDYCSPGQIVTVQRVGVIKTGKLERREVRTNLGERCENDGRKTVGELTECPADIALGVKITPGMYQVNELDWMKRRM